MKNKYFVFIILMLLLIGGCNKQKISWYAGQLDNAFIIAENKIIMIEFYTDW